MKQEKQTIDELTEDLHKYLRSIRRSEHTIRLYVIAWKKLKNYMISHRLKFYDSRIGEAFLVSELGKYKYENLTTNKKNFVNKIESLTDFQYTGRVLLGKRLNPPKVFSGIVGKTMEDFIEFRKNAYSLAQITVNNYRLYLHSFFCFLNDRSIRVLSKITLAEISQFLRRLNSTKSAAQHMALGVLRTFTKYLYEEKLISEDYSQKIPSDNYRQQAQIPSTFSKEEIDQLIAVIDRANPKGKRDYAIFLLALKLGFRASDIASLKFANIFWSVNEFNFEQQKTAKSITLPILPEVGNALIDYLKYGRPVSSEKHVFLQVIPPYQKIVPHDVANCLRFYLKRAGINVHNRKHGPHALRHSFASCLLNNGTPLPVISEALGHTTSLSTMFYLRIDTSSLKQCALEAPRLPFAFYMQKGGYHE